MAVAVTGNIWARKGISLLWDLETLSNISNADDVYSLREFLNFYEFEEWPDELRSSDGFSMIVSGLESIIDMMPPFQATSWIEQHLYPALLSFQDMYEGQCALLFWVPGFPNRLLFDISNQLFSLQGIGKYREEQIPLSLCLWNGAAKDARLISKNSLGINLTDKDCIGLYHPRIS